MENVEHILNNKGKWGKMPPLKMAIFFENINDLNI